MPRSVGGLFELTPEAIGAEIDSHLGSQATRLDARVFASYPLRQLHAGWQILVACSGVTRRLNILLPNEAPFRPPLVALADPPPKLTWPHVEDDGVLCLLPESTAVDYTRPLDVLDKVLEEAVELIETCSGSNCDDEFRREFVPYWARASEKGITCVSLLQPQPPSRIVRIWQTEQCWIVAEDEMTLLRWMSNRFGASAGATVSAEAPLVWLDRPMAPREFPSDGSHLKDLLRHADSAALPIATKFIEEDFFSIPVILGALGDNGPCLGALALRRRPSSSTNRGVNAMTKGFRRGYVPRSVTVARALSHLSTTSRVQVQRADVDWVHNRGLDDRVRMLNSSKVVVLGCGSLGAAVATHLAMAGVGNFVLFDPQTLTWPNTGRHPLGAAQVDANKAAALSEELRKRFPHVTAVAISKRWQEVSEWPDAVNGSSLIVSASGDWGSEAALNFWARRTNQTVPIVYGWTEAHACGGQAVCIAASGNCLQCGFESDGKPKIALTKWSGVTTKQEPGCGTAFQPYGPIEFSHVVALVSELGIQSLLDRPSVSAHCVWFGATSRLHELNGEWNHNAIESFGDPATGERIARRNWPQDVNCPVCSSR